MSNFVIRRLKSDRIRDLHRMRSEIQLEPPYQRLGDIWSLSRRRLLVDSILNNYDIPKIYFRHFVPAHSTGSELVSYSVIDGRQRLEALWSFMDDEFTLGTDVEVHDAPATVNAAIANARFSDLMQSWPDLGYRLLDFELDVVTIETDDLELIEDMFLRLNEAAPLNAAEKRNALGGPLPVLYRDLAAHVYFTDRLPFQNKRYRHFDMAAKFLYFEDRGGIADTKRVYLDRFAKDLKERAPGSLEVLRERVLAVLDVLAGVFGTSDRLLASVGMSSVYYLVARHAYEHGWVRQFTRRSVAEFEVKRSENRRLARISEEDANYDLLEFDRYSQSANDAVALRLRRDVLLEFFGYHVHEPLID